MSKRPHPHLLQAQQALALSILFYPITLEGRRGTTDEFATTPFHLDLFSAALVELAKSIPVHSLILSSHLFFCLPLFLFPFTVPCRIVFAKQEDIETWPNHLSFRFLTRVRSSSYSPMAAWIFLRTSSLVTWSLLSSKLQYARALKVYPGLSHHPTIPITSLIKHGKDIEAFIHLTRIDD